MTQHEPEETPVTGFGNPSLDADPISDDLDAALDAALDEAEGIAPPEVEEPASPEAPETPEESLSSEDETTLPPADPPAEQTAPIESAPAPSEIDPEIAAIEQPRNLSEKNQSNWRRLQETASVYKKQAQEAEALRQQLAERESNPPTPPDYEELRKFRAIFDIQSDPDFQKKYDEPINAAKHNIYALLKKNGAADAVVESIEKSGGPDKIDSSWWVNNIISKLPLADAERVKKSLVDVTDLQERRVSEIQKSAENASQYYQEREAAAQNWFQTEQEQIYKHIETRIRAEKAEWAMMKEIPAGATPEQIKAIRSHNKSVEQLQSTFDSALWPKTAQERADVAAAAAMSHVLTNQLRTEQESRQRLQAQLKALTEENTRLKGAGKLPRQTVATAVSNKSSVNDRLKMSASDAIDLGLDEAGE